jgi:hypothetical protein
MLVFAIHHRRLVHLARNDKIEGSVDLVDGLARGVEEGPLLGIVLLHLDTCIIFKPAFWVIVQ